MCNQLRKGSSAWIAALLLAGPMIAYGADGADRVEAAAPPSSGPGDVHIAVPAADGLLSPDGPLSAGQVYSLKPEAVTQAFDQSQDASAPRALDKLRRASQADRQLGRPAPRLDSREGAAQTYTYLYCYATAWLRDGGQRLRLGSASAAGDYLGAWATSGTPDSYVQVPIEVPPQGSSSVLSSHLVYYTTRYTPAELDAMCRTSLLAQARQLQRAEYPHARGSVELSHVVARGRNNSLALDHPFLAQPASVGDGRIHTLVSLGDSLSDTDATSNMLYHYIPHRSTWFAGHFTNGWVWSEYAARDLGVQAYNEAWGGAGSQTQPVVDWFPGSTWFARVGYGLRLPSIVLQTDLYGEHVATQFPRDPDETLYTLLIGGNDFIGYDEPTQTVLDAVAEAVGRLISVDGARNIVVMNLPDISTAPVLNGGSRSSIKARVQERLDAYDARLPALIAELVARYPQAHLTLFDTRGVFDSIVRNARAHGFIDTARSCLLDPSEMYASPAVMRAGCNGRNYVFWDGMHPTTVVHELLGKAFAEFARQHYNF